MHKARNVRDKLPAKDNGATLGRLHRAWANRNAAKGEAAIRALAAELQSTGYVEAAGSLREGLVETLTCHRLGLPSDLCRVLVTTNAIESAFSRHGALAHRVKRWRDGRQAKRWLATSLVLAEQSFSALPAAEHLAVLATALARHVAALPPVAVGA